MTDLCASTRGIRFIRSHERPRALDEVCNEAARHVAEVTVRTAAARCDSRRRVLLRHCFDERQHAHERTRARTRQRRGRQLRRPKNERRRVGAVLRLRALRRASVVATSGRIARTAAARLEGKTYGIHRGEGVA